MKTLNFIAALVLTSTIVQAEERQLDGTEIKALLPDIKAVSENSQQVFLVEGPTHYVEIGRLTTGKWWVTETQYCSTWPPANMAACYDVLIDESTDPVTLVWIRDSGQRIVNWIEPKD